MNKTRKMIQYLQEIKEQIEQDVANDVTRRLMLSMMYTLIAHVSDVKTALEDAGYSYMLKDEENKKC